MKKSPRLSRFIAAWAASSFVLAAGLMVCVMIVTLFSGRPDRDLILTVLGFITAILLISSMVRSKHVDPAASKHDHWLLKLWPWRRRRKVILYDLHRKPPPPPETLPFDEPLPRDDRTTWVPSSRPRKPKQRRSTN